MTPPSAGSPSVGPSVGPNVGPNVGHSPQDTVPVGAPSVRGDLTVRAITEREHLDFIRTRRSASFLQTPAWGQVKSEWRRESLGWFRDASSLGSSTQGFKA